MKLTPDKKGQGFALPAAIFLLVVLVGWRGG